MQIEIPNHSAVPKDLTLGRDGGHDHHESGKQASRMLARRHAHYRPSLILCYCIGTQRVYGETGEIDGMLGRLRHQEDMKGICLPVQDTNSFVRQGTC